MQVDRDKLREELLRLAITVSPHSTSEPEYRRGFTRGKKFTIERIIAWLDKEYPV